MVCRSSFDITALWVGSIVLFIMKLGKLRQGPDCWILTKAIRQEGGDCVPGCGDRHLIAVTKVSTFFCLGRSLGHTEPQMPIYEVSLPVVPTSSCHQKCMNRE